MFGMSQNMIDLFALCNMDKRVLGFEGKKSRKIGDISYENWELYRWVSAEHSILCVFYKYFFYDRNIPSFYRENGVS